MLEVLKIFPSMPFPNDFQEFEIYNHLILEELAYNKVALESEHKYILYSMTNEQKGVYEKTMNAINLNADGMFFICV